jgi:hypothetical protein
MSETEIYISRDELGASRVQKLKTLFKLAFGKEIEIVYELDGICNSCDDRRGEPTPWGDLG